jgi:hypothetical protein
MQPLPKLRKLARKPRQIDERCGICGCRLHRTGSYALPTPEGRSHATEHHYVAERFFGRSTNRKNEQRDRIFEHCPWGLERQSGVFCYECHEELLHNPVLTKADIERFAALVQRRGLSEGGKVCIARKARWSHSTTPGGDRGWLEIAGGTTLISTICL